VGTKPGKKRGSTITEEKEATLPFKVRKMMRDSTPGRGDNFDTMKKKGILLEKERGGGRGAVLCLEEEGRWKENGRREKRLQVPRAAGEGLPEEAQPELSKRMKEKEEEGGYGTEAVEKGQRLPGKCETSSSPEELPTVKTLPSGSFRGEKIQGSQVGGREVVTLEKGGSNKRITSGLGV